MNYNYMCESCSNEQSPFVFGVEHGMSETPEIKCPKCGGSRTQKCFAGLSPTVYVRGNGYLDKQGCRRDMELYNLRTKNPYGHLYQPGEQDEIAHQLKAGGRIQKSRSKDTLKKCYDCGELFWTKHGDFLCSKCREKRVGI